MKRRYINQHLIPVVVGHIVPYHNVQVVVPAYRLELLIGSLLHNTVWKRRGCKWGWVISGRIIIKNILPVVVGHIVTPHIVGLVGYCTPVAQLVLSIRNIGNITSPPVQLRRPHLPLLCQQLLLLIVLNL